MNYSVSSKFVKDSFVLILTIDNQVKYEIITPLDAVAMEMVVMKVKTFLEDYVNSHTEDIELEQEDDTLFIDIIDEDGSIQSSTEYYEDYIEYINADDDMIETPKGKFNE